MGELVLLAFGAVFGALWTLWARWLYDRYLVKRGDKRAQRALLRPLEFELSQLKGWLEAWRMTETEDGPELSTATMSASMLLIRPAAELLLQERRKTLGLVENKSVRDAFYAICIDLFVLLHSSGAKYTGSDLQRHITQVANSVTPRVAVAEDALKAAFRECS